MWVTSIKEVNKKGTDRLLPYSLLGYDFPANCINVKYHMINANTVLRPYIGIPDFDRKWDYHATSKKCLLQERYWGIRYAATDRGTGYGDASTVQANPSLTQEEMRNIYLQLREQGGNGRGGTEEEGDDGDFSDIESDDSSAHCPHLQQVCVYCCCVLFD
jgi:hypothetical protein